LTLGFLFWLIWILCLIFGGVGVLRTDPAGRWHFGGFSLVLWILLGLLGWQVFGSPLKG
jgi:hypothetical protein